MDWVETTGRTVEEAKRAALEQLGVGEMDADVEVLSEPKLGLFGRLREEARVRARVQPRYPRSKVDRRDRRRSKGAQTERQPGSETKPAEDKVGPTVTEAPAVPKERASRGRVRAAAAEGKAAPARRRRSGSAATADSNPEAEGIFNEMNTEPIEAQTELAESFLRGLVSELGADATVSSRPLGEGIVEVQVQGEGLGALIGPKGSTLAALQELTRTVLQRQGSAEGRIVVDVNGYRKRRQEALARFAQEVAVEVIASGAKRALEPMPAPDRKVVHDAVSSIAGISSSSEGEEPYRRVVLVPAEGTATNEVPAAPEAEDATP